ncbi:serine hydrolase [Fulvivirga lutimaris]|uniref:serine hydrolase n=1 Tax=Fulvivirga lutimaris TaxID=1819566 RepID=UPI0012BBA4A3|nr:serine hydrolase [Fulvivirga lutimaris]MTI41465.1 glycosyl hydrolase [Fulvivirga lutimaris]
MLRKVLVAVTLVFITKMSVAQLNSDAKSRWVDSVYQALTMEQRIGQLFIMAAYSSGNKQHHDVIENHIRKYNIGGVIFFDGDPANQIRLTNKYQKSADVPLLIGLDARTGLSKYLDSTLTTPDYLTMGAVQNDGLIRDLANDLASQLNLLGVNFTVGPSGLMPDELSFDAGFSTDPLILENKAKIFIDAFKERNILGFSEYFPGYYHDNQSDKILEIKRSKKELDNHELRPIKSLATNNADGIIVSHVLTDLDKKKTPSSLSENSIKVLKEEIGYKGLIVSDALSDKMLLDKYKPGKLEAMAFKAGNDILLMSTNISSSVKQIRRQINRGDIPRMRLENSVKKILAHKYDLGLSQPKAIDAQNISIKLNKPESQLTINKVLRAAPTVVQEKNILPIKSLDEKTFATVSFGDQPIFDDYLDKYNYIIHYNLSLDKYRLEENLSSYDYVIIGLFDQFQIVQASELVNKLKDKTKVIVCSFVNPFLLKSVESAGALVINYNTDIESIKLAPQIIFGAQGASGRLPVGVSEKLALGSGVNTKSIDRLAFGTPEEVGMDSKILNKINDIAKEAINDQATPGCQIIVARHGKIIFNQSLGYYTYDSIDPISDKTIYDVASITKVAATTQALMFLEERKLIDMDKKISYYLPELKGSNKENMIIRDILTHQAGLWPYLPFWKQTVEDTLNYSAYYKESPSNDYSLQISDGLYSSRMVKDSVWNWVINSKVREKPHRRPYDYKYSDMGYYMLMRLVENMVNQPIDEFLQQNFYDPMGLSTMSYLPLCKYPLTQIAPTEYDNYFRRTLVYGLVHDQGAAMIGGVAGHAGLFSNALDLAKLMQMNMQDGKYGDTRYFMSGTVNSFASQQYASNRRGMGWDKPVVGQWNSPTSAYASGKTFGHTGFTGTAAWADPEFDLVYIFLSNRIYPDAENRKLIKNNIRTRIQDLIYQSMWNYSATHCTDEVNKE